MKRIAVAVLCGLLVLTGCSTDKNSSQQKGQKESEQAFKQQSGSVPYPVNELKDSLERRNIRERLLRTNKPNAIGYVYILSFGKFIGYYTIKGKVSSTQSQMTTGTLFVRPCSGCDKQPVDSPGDDGSYGDNEPGIFFFTTDGAMVETSADYIVSDQPLAVADVPELNK